MSELLFPLGLLVFMLASSGVAQINNNCIFESYLEDNESYYVHNNEYPNNFIGSRSCMWRARSSHRIRLTCTEFDLQMSTNCYRAYLAVGSNSTDTRRYCGTQPFKVESEGREMIIRLQSLSHTQGKFLCTLQAIPKIDNDNCRCGWKNPTRIVGGTETGVNEFPMMAGLVTFETGGIVICGATIISNRYVVTAAHCVVSVDVTRLAVVVGEHNVNTGTDTNATRIHRADTKIVHPNYRSTESGYDIAIIKTSTNMMFNQQVGPVCLPFQHSPDTFYGSYVTLLGWGLEAFDGPKSDTLMKVDVSVILSSVCRKYYSNIIDSQMCTYTEGKDACQYDSGSPLLWQNPTTRNLVLAGIVSYGRSCADKYPGVNTRVGSFVDWIQSATPEVTYCQVE